MLKLSSIEICATSNVNRAWQIAGQRLPFENGINSYQKTPRPTCFLQRAIIKIRPIFLARADEKLDSTRFTLFYGVVLNYISKFESISICSLCILHERRVFHVDTAFFRKGTI